MNEAYELLNAAFEGDSNISISLKISEIATLLDFIPNEHLRQKYIKECIAKIKIQKEKT